MQKNQKLSPELLFSKQLPYITPELAGIGGEIKSQPDHFVVEEIPLYEPVGDGEHIYVRFTREGWTTRGLQKHLAQMFGLREWSIGYAGLKDKHARVTQTFSLHLPNVKSQIPNSKSQIPKESLFASQSADGSVVGRDLLNIQQTICEHLHVEVHWVKRHRNKLRTGHLQGNRFRILVLETCKNALARAQTIAAALAERGIPNYYGEQRFGIDGDNALRGLEILQGRGTRQRWKKRFLIDALRSALFNAWLVDRIKRGSFETLLAGDIARKCDSGGLFEVDDLETELERFHKGEIAYTGPMYGTGMKWAGGEAGKLEHDLLAQAGITEAVLQRARVDGTRRVARILVDDLQIEAHPQGLWFSFTLPPGAYATTVLREFMKMNVGCSTFRLS